MFFHRANNCPRHHHGRGGGVAAVFLFRDVAGFANSIPARVDLQVGGNNTAELASDRRRKRRLSRCSRGRWPRLCLKERFWPPAVSDRGYSFLCRRFGGQDTSELLTYLNCVTDFDLPFAHCSSERRFDRINSFVGFYFAKGVVQRDGISRVLQ